MTTSSAFDRVIRRLDAADVQSFKAIRLASLREAPTAFSTEGSVEARMRAEEIANRLARDVVFGAECTHRLVGIVGLERQEGLKLSHRGVIWGLYVLPSHRRKGIARQLMGALEAEVGCDLEILELEVVIGNEPAHYLYETLGYSVYGKQPKALKINGEYFERLLMYKELGWT